ncbi:four helix bundle protein [Oxalobacteraceae bacterium A2-2]
MTIHTQLPIYKVAYDLLGLAADLVKNMPRDFKGSFGRKINEECIEILVLIARANAARDKAPHLGELLERLQVAEILIRLARDKRFISVPQYAGAVELCSQIGKQANGWKKHPAARLQHEGQGHHA